MRYLLKAHAITKTMCKITSYMRHAMWRVPLGRLRNSTWIKEGTNRVSYLFAHFNPMKTHFHPGVIAQVS